MAYGGMCQKGLLLLTFYGVLTFLVDLPCWLGDHEAPFRQTWSPWVRALAYATIIILISFVGVSDAVPFIYSEF